jgi:hypothetical protein
LIKEILRVISKKDNNFIKGFENIEEALKTYKKTSNVPITNFTLTVFGSIILENGTIIQANNKYHNTSWFSDVSIVMNFEEIFEYMTDNGICYGKVNIFK